MIKRAYRYRFYPTKEQAELLAKTFGCVRFVYNNILRWRTDEYFDSEQRVDYLVASRRLTELKKQEEYSWLNEVSSVALQQSIRHQQAAFKNFFQKRAKYPKFRKKNDRQSAEFTVSGFRYVHGKLYIAKSNDSLNIRWSRGLPSNPSSITVSKDASERYFVSCLCEVEPQKLPVVSSTVGIDLGIKNLFVTDKGFKVGNPNYTKKYASKLAREQRRLSKKKLGGRNRKKARIKVARVHAKISDCRLDNLHKLSRRLVNENQVICAESLKVKNMVRNPVLSKSISDAGWGEFTRQLEYKSEWGDRTFVKIDQFFPSSKRCSSCGYTLGSLSLSVRRWMCPECHEEHDRDINAARNIKAVGLAVLAFGEGVGG